MGSLREELQAIYESHGKLTPSLVVDQARDKSHPLHTRFEWDDKVAGEAYRRGQAHELIRSVRVVYREATETEAARSVRAFHAVRSEGPQNYVYEPLERVTDDPLLTRIVLRDMEREWKQLMRRYGQFKEFAEMVRKDLSDEAA